MSNNSKILVAFITGTLLGGILGVLFAPQKGDKTRKNINEGSKKFAEDFKGKFKKGKEKFKDLKENVEETVKDKIKDFA